MRHALGPRDPPHPHQRQEGNSDRTRDRYPRAEWNCYPGLLGLNVGMGINILGACSHKERRPRQGATAQRQRRNASENERVGDGARAAGQRAIRIRIRPGRNRASAEVANRDGPRTEDYSGPEKIRIGRPDACRRRGRGGGGGVAAAASACKRRQRQPQGNPDEQTIGVLAQGELLSEFDATTLALSHKLLGVLY